MLNFAETVSVGNGRKHVIQRVKLAGCRTAKNYSVPVKRGDIYAIGEGHARTRLLAGTQRDMTRTCERSTVGCVRLRAARVLGRCAAEMVARAYEMGSPGCHTDGAVTNAAQMLVFIGTGRVSGQDGQSTVVVV